MHLVTETSPLGNITDYQAVDNERRIVWLHVGRDFHNATLNHRASRRIELDLQRDEVLALALVCTAALRDEAMRGPEGARSDAADVLDAISELARVAVPPAEVSA